jgi:hypothetical protein
MAIYLTEYRDYQGRRWCGPNIRAKNLTEANRALNALRKTRVDGVPAETMEALRESILIVGVLVETIDYETREQTLYTPPQEECLQRVRHVPPPNPL